MAVIRRIHRQAGCLTLVRPRALNALDIGMVRELEDALDTWRDDPAVAAVVLDGAGDRGFCAGGDVRGLREQIVGGDPEDAGIFFRAEYALNATIADYPKPVVALAEGVTMGGGIGLAGHAGVRIVTERSALAMPETRIGFTPDVGGSWLLARAPGRLGEYLALTGSTMTAADALFAGFADGFALSTDLDAVREAAASGATIVPAYGPAPSALAAAQPWIDDVFAAPTVAEIRGRLRAHDEPAARETAALLDTLSPTALAVTLEAVRRARSLSLHETLVQEYGLVMWFVMTQPDLVEGIRALLVDKDRRPRWHPDHDVDAGVVADAFAYRPTVPLELTGSVGA